MSLADHFEVGERELIAFTGGGGKSTLLFTLARELAARGDRVLVTTTTKMGPDQADEVPGACDSADPADVGRALNGPGPVMLVTLREPTKIRGPDPGEVDRLFAAADLDHLLVEADGSRGRPLKAPAAHEPVVPLTTTLAVVVMGLDAVGRPLGEVAHRPPEAAALTGLGSHDAMDGAACARVLGHAQGGLKGIPRSARVVVALTKAEPGPRSEAAAEITARLAGHGRVARIVLFPGSRGKTARAEPEQ